jgi:putative ABC transport system permease protein
MFRNYIKTAWKIMLRRKFFTLVSLFTIGFTLMMLMTIAAILDHYFQAAAPEIHSARTLHFTFDKLRGTNPFLIQIGNPGFALLHRYTRGMPFVENESFYTNANNVYSYLDGKKTSFLLKRTDGAFWQILSFAFIEGAPYNEDDNRMARRVVVINEGLRERFFGREPALGKMLEADGQQFRIVGVVKNVPAFRVIPYAEAWAPIRTSKTDSYFANLTGDFNGLYLARSRNDFSAIKAEFQSRLRDAELPDPKKFRRWEAQLNTYRENVYLSIFLQSGLGWTSEPKTLLPVFLACIFLFITPPTITLVNLNVSRILERVSEIGVRKAFGASSIQLIGQFLVENLLLTLLGGVLGFCGSLMVLHAINQSHWFAYAVLQLNYSIFVYGILLALLFGIFSGLYPAWRMSRFHPVQALRGGRQ